ncbi:hypothetical protein [Rhizobium paknamense]|uniref:KTSC domain-containing protein n=1 Tax=Rhizobium paknamense TaxID=1206817 RepID=A0ABU0I8P4_9HYPH|nr:hypothetical protein [Rhizobium paknamense]MDQ0454042.1 hypothetical protein [Rhizobium paknamense]
MKSMFSAGVLLAVSFVATDALAIQRYNSTTMTCEGVRQAVRSEGATILRYPSKRVAGMTLYDRYVRDRGFCNSNEYAERATVPTRDNPACPVLNCQPIEDLDTGFLRIIPNHRL